MESAAGYSVSLQRAVPRTIAAVRALVPASRVPAVFAGYLDQVYAAARSGHIQVDGQNVFVYRNVPDQPDHVDVEFGVGTTTPFVPIGQVRPIDLPVGDVATTTHWGAYTRLGAAHHAVIDWCRAHGRDLAGPRWEVYGHWTEDESRRRTDVYYLVQPAGRAS